MEHAWHILAEAYFWLSSPAKLKHRTSTAMVALTGLASIAFPFIQILQQSFSSSPPGRIHVIIAVGLYVENKVWLWFPQLNLFRNAFHPTITPSQAGAHPTIESCSFRCFYLPPWPRR
jgi:hypothetical protein